MSDEECCECGSDEVICRNYKGEPFCGSCGTAFVLTPEKDATTKTVTMQVTATFYGDYVHADDTTRYLQQWIETGCEDRDDLLGVEFGTAEVTETDGHPDDETWLVTPDTITDVGLELSRHHTVTPKPYRDLSTNRLLGLTLWAPQYLTVRFGDTIVRSGAGEWSVVKGEPVPPPLAPGGRGCADSAGNPYPHHTYDRGTCLRCSMWEPKS